jgi:ABC-type multidrug transport system fused ATPase/permease subunit
MELPHSLTDEQPMAPPNLGLNGIINDHEGISSATTKPSRNENLHQGSSSDLTINPMIDDPQKIHDTFAKPNITDTPIGKIPEDDGYDRISDLENLHGEEHTDLHDHQISKVFKTEHQETGAVSCKSYGSYVKRIGGPFVVFLILIMFGVGSGFQQYSYLYLIYWAKDFTPKSEWANLGHYAWIAGFFVLVGMLGNIIMVFGNLRMLRILYQSMTFRVLHSKIDEFIERIPTGRIINRFSKDIDNCDKSLMQNYSFFLTTFFGIFAQLVFVVLVLNWWMAFVVVP